MSKLTTIKAVQEASRRGDLYLRIALNNTKPFYLQRAVDVQVLGNTRLEVGEAHTVDTHDYARVITHDVKRVNAYHGIVTCLKDTDVRAYNRSFVIVSGRSTCKATGDAQIHASESAFVKIMMRATAYLSGKVTCVAQDDTHVVACELEKVYATDNAHVSLSGEASAVVSATSTTIAYGHSTVRAHGYAIVHAYGHSQVLADESVTVFVHSSNVNVEGGQQVLLWEDHKRGDVKSWLRRHKVQVTDGKAVLYKCTDADGISGAEYNDRREWVPGKVVKPTYWVDDSSCGDGIHLSPEPVGARSYRCHADAHMFKVQVNVKDIRVLGNDKCKVPKCLVLEEIDPFDVGM